jgi:Carboxypeptidase regulatory-like domain
VLLLKRFRSIISLLILMLCLSPSLLGQAVNATLLGTITDSTGATVPGAKVTATETATGLIHESVTNDSGNYTIPDIPPGKYSITAEAKGLRLGGGSGNDSARLAPDRSRRYQHKDRSESGCRTATWHQSQLPISSQYSSRHGACDLPALTIFQCGEFVADRGERYASHGQSVSD